jgi:nucleotide-binding universal stress UspA family protein
VVPTSWATQGYDPDLQHRLEEADEKAASAYLAQVAERLREEGVSVQTRLLHGRPSRALVAAAKLDECRMVVVTSHGMSGLGSRVFGSVAQRVLASAPCPVLVVPCAASDLAEEEEIEELASDQAMLRSMEQADQVAKR